MNIIREKAIANNFDYVFHMEDDWQYVQKRDYISECLNILENSEIKLGQVLVNKNYSEVELSKRPIGGGVVHKTADKTRYIVHEYYEPGTKEHDAFTERNKGVGNCGYWPHFSFRPSLLKVEMLKEVGPYYNTGHFEMQYAYEYVDKGYSSAFIDTFSSIHIGKKTWERNGINSYNLNNTGQFAINSEKLSVKVICDTTDPSKWTTFKETAVKHLPYMNRHIPKEKIKLDELEKRIFAGNNFNWLRSTMKHILSHLDVLRNETSDYTLVLTDNVVLFNDCSKLLNELLDLLKDNSYDFIMLDQAFKTDSQELQIIEHANKDIQLEKMDGYIISKEGRQKILKYVLENGIKDFNYLENFTDIKTFNLNQKLYNRIAFNGFEKFMNDKNKEDQFQELEGYRFYSLMDSFSNDIGSYGKKSVQELKLICDHAKDAKAFNTLGWVKNKVTDEKDFIILPTTTDSRDGLYIKL